MGLEDCFKLCPLILKCYGKYANSEEDNSVELYLLNNWSKELSLRDLIDRVGLAVKETSTFQYLFKWLMNERLQAASEEWSIEDFRKVSVHLAKNIQCIEVKDFFCQAVEVQGEQKVREFMEIQLMHSQNDYNVFMDWFTTKFRQEEQEMPKKSLEKPKTQEIEK
mmetsp:Transcript_22838/g.22090  ORF Transcript_22838/g.22090 Transcript_22838/m.22090 type:complete len:165 (-) Transcript_22838:1806-2300(-)